VRTKRGAANKGPRGKKRSTRLARGRMIYAAGVERKGPNSPKSRERTRVGKANDEELKTRGGGITPCRGGGGEKGREQFFQSNLLSVTVTDTTRTVPIEEHMRRGRSGYPRV